jgi:diphosphomevalonate decarboxylase
MIRLNTLQKLPNKLIVSGPSNIAFVKYWGKYGIQLPINTSVSMTLKNCVTKCEISYTARNESKGFELESYEFMGKENPKFYDRFNNYLTNILDILPGLNRYKISISSTNTFPHSAGIASSASAFSALAYAIACLASEHKKDSLPFQKQCSELARLGSGSAARSINGPYMQWGEDEFINGSSNECANIVTDVHPEFLHLKDTILLVDKNEKAVSSSVGHSLMHGHPFKESRILQAKQNTRTILKAIKNGDWVLFGEILENEALTLHALMMSSYPSFILLKPNSLEIIERVKEFRNRTKLSLYFTIDAGPNIHLIYKKSEETVIEEFIKKELIDLCHEGSYIIDESGTGAGVINEQ